MKMNANLYDRSAASLSEEVTETLYAGEWVRIERIILDRPGISRGFVRPKENEWVCVLEGRELSSGGRQHKVLDRGEWILIPLTLDTASFQQAPPRPACGLPFSGSDKP